MYFTLVAIVCNNTTIQPLLPQIIFLGASSITKAQFTALKNQLPSNVFLKRMPKGWNNSDEHRVIVKLLAVVLAKFPEFRPILCFDAAPLHLTPQVLQELVSGSLLFLLVPAKMTWLLQPLNTHGFLKFKLYLKQKFVESVIQGSPDEHKTSRMVRLVVRAIRYVLQAHAWECAFKQNGIWSDQSMVSSTIRRELCYEQVPLVGNTRPTAEMLRTLWPKNRALHTDLVMSLLPASLPVSTTPSSSSAGAASSSSASLPAAASQRRRLRSKTSVSANMS